MSSTITQLDSSEFPERCVVLHKRDPLIHTTTDKHAWNSCEMMFASVNINGKGLPAEGLHVKAWRDYIIARNKGLHPTGMLYGIGDSIAQIQLNHSSTPTGDNGYTYKLDPNLDVVNDIEFFSAKDA